MESVLATIQSQIVLMVDGVHGATGHNVQGHVVWESQLSKGHAIILSKSSICYPQTNLAL